MSAGFQSSAFQNNAFQTSVAVYTFNMPLPVNCVLMGEQLYDGVGRTLERIPGRSGRKMILIRGGGGRFGAESSFSSRTSSRGYD